MGKLISVIVPIHNSEKYLPQCLESIIAQTYRNLEIILVDDYSDDRSPAICDEYAQKDSRIRVFHKKTKGGEGGAKARNEGMSYTKGKIVYFMDSDDYIESNMLEQMYLLMCRERSDCVITSFRYVDSEGKELPWRVPKLSNYQAMRGRDAAGVFLTTLNIEGFSWNKMFRKELLTNYHISFDESMNSFVDVYGMFKAVLSSQKVSFYDARPYSYRQHETSCVHTIDRRKLGNYKRMVGQIQELAGQNGLSGEGQFFRMHRMMIQLFDAVKGKKNFDKAVWKQLKEEYKWAAVFEEPLWKVYKIIFANLEDGRMKAGIKLLCVRLSF